MCVLRTACLACPACALHCAGGCGIHWLTGSALWVRRTPSTRSSNLKQSNVACRVERRGGPTCSFRRYARDYTDEKIPYPLVQALGIGSASYSWEFCSVISSTPGFLLPEAHAIFLGGGGGRLHVASLKRPKQILAALENSLDPAPRHREIRLQGPHEAAVQDLLLPDAKNKVSGPVTFPRGHDEYEP